MSIMSVTTEQSSTETITSRVSFLSCEKDFEEDLSRSSASINICSVERNTATQPLTEGNATNVRSYTSAPNYIPFACLAALLNPVLGIPALVCGYLSKKNKRRGSSTAASKYSELALWLSIVAIATALVLMVFIAFYIFVITPNIIRSIKGFSLENEHYHPDIISTSTPSLI